MTVLEARAVRIKFGKHKGSTLGEIVDSDILYLDFLVGATIFDPVLKLAVDVLGTAYATEIAKAVDDN